MKLHINKAYILGLVAVCGGLASCSHEDPTLFGGESDGFYFNYESKDDLSSTINFADSIVKEPEAGYIPLRIRLLGHLSDKATPIVLKTEAVDGYEQAQVSLPKIEIKAGGHDTTIYVTVARPAQEGVTYAAKVSFEQGDKSMKDFDSFVVYATETYEQPSGWSDDVYGAWNAEKYKFLAKTFGKADFCSARSDVQWNEYNPQAVEAVRAWHAEHPGEEIPYDIPFLSDTYLYYGSYEQPAYWGDLQDKYLGAFDSESFKALASGMGLTTQNEEQVLGSINENDLKELNKKAVLNMMQNYNNKFAQGADYWSMNSVSVVPMVDGVQYDVVEPSWWVDDQTGPMIEQYYGAYSAEKYKRMLQIAIREKGDELRLFKMFPIQLYYDYESYESIPQWLSWDLYDDNWNWIGSASGESIIYEYYQMFKKAEPSLFPDDVPDPDGGWDDYSAKSKKNRRK